MTKGRGTKKEWTNHLLVKCMQRVVVKMSMRLIVQPPQNGRTFYDRKERLLINADSLVQGYEELKWSIIKLDPLCNGPETC